MPETMVEKIARAIAGIAFAESHEGDAESEWDRVVPLAVAALEALREPTEAMRAAWDKDWQAWLDHHIEDDDHLYRVMIDAALSEGAER